MKAFIDEYGDTSISIEMMGVTEYYILTAIIIEENHENDLVLALEKIAKQSFSGGEIKSSNIGNNHIRRLKILDQIVGLEYFAYSLVIDKKLLYSEGFGFKGSFFKFLNGKIYRILIESYNDIIIYHDEYGRNVFMDEFQKYLSTRYPSDLFNSYESKFIKSNNRIIQLADFISGTIAKALDENNTYQRAIYQKLKKIKVVIDQWPLRIYENKQVNYEKNLETDSLIESIAINAFIEYINKNIENIDHDTMLRVQFLKYLYQKHMYISKEKYTFTDELRNYLKYFDNGISVYGIRSKIIAPLRDEGIPIASTAKGYKIPSTKNDLIDYIRLSKGIIVPMQKRLCNLKKMYMIKSVGKIELDNSFGFPEDLEKSIQNCV